MGTRRNRRKQMEMEEGKGEKRGKERGRGKKRENKESRGRLPKKCHIKFENHRFIISENLFLAVFQSD
jgi:hypothetical protein